MDIVARIKEESTSDDDPKTKHEKIEAYEAQQEQIQAEIKQIEQKKAQDQVKGETRQATSKTGNSTEQQLTAVAVPGVVAAVDTYA